VLDGAGIKSALTGGDCLRLNDRFCVFHPIYLTEMVVADHELWPYSTTLLIAVVLSQIFFSLSPGLNADTTGICLKPSKPPILFSII